MLLLIVASFFYWLLPSQFISACGQGLDFVSHVRSREIDVVGLWFGETESHECGIHDCAYKS